MINYQMIFNKIICRIFFCLLFMLVLAAGCQSIYGFQQNQSKDKSQNKHRGQNYLMSDAANRSAALVAVSPLGLETVPDKPGRRSSEDVQLAKATQPSAVDNAFFDVVVVGGTGSGVACAVRAAREGCRVLLVQHDSHLGGMMTNGLKHWDTLYGGPRGALFTELLGNIESHYIKVYGRDSETHQRLRYTHQHYPISWIEPHVAEREFNRLVAGEKNITVLLNHYPTAVDREDTLVKSLTLRHKLPGNVPDKASSSIKVYGATFVDATYEGDLFAVVGVPYRVGRESRQEYNEPHAGKIYTNIDKSPTISVVREGLNIRQRHGRQGSISPFSPFTGDDAIQAYNFRFTLSCDPQNRVAIGKPDNYRREEYLTFTRGRGMSGRKSQWPNGKIGRNASIMPGANHAYPEADWPTREKIIQRHLDFGLGFLWFAQNDESIPLKRRQIARKWGLAKDEYIDNNHVPYELYVREARRIVGRYIFTQHDNMFASDYARAPINSGSIATTDWFMDSHSCTKDGTYGKQFTKDHPGFMYEGKIHLSEETRPGQIPYDCLLPRGVDNLLVPVCLSATHIAWGAVRLEPVFMQTGEAAGWAAALAKKHKTTPAALDVDLLVKTLLKNQHLVSFFNDIKAGDPDPAIAAAQYFATKGFFCDYNASLDKPLTKSVSKVWAQGMDELKKETLKPRELAAKVQKAYDNKKSKNTKYTRGEMILKMWDQIQ